MAKKQKKMTLDQWMALPNALVKRAKPVREERRTLAEWNRDPYLVQENGKKMMPRKQRKAKRRARS